MPIASSDPAADYGFDFTSNGSDQWLADGSVDTLEYAYPLAVC